MTRYLSLFIVLIISCNGKQVAVNNEFYFSRENNAYQLNLTFFRGTEPSLSSKLFELEMRIFTAKKLLWGKERDVPIRVQFKKESFCSGSISSNMIIESGLNATDSLLDCSGELQLDLFGFNSKILESTGKYELTPNELTQLEEQAKPALYHRDAVKKNGNNINLNFQIRFLVDSMTNELTSVTLLNREKNILENGFLYLGQLEDLFQDSQDSKRVYLRIQ